MPTLIFFPRPRNVDDKPYEHARLLLVPCYVSLPILSIASFIYFKSVLRITNLRAPLRLFHLVLVSSDYSSPLSPLLSALFPQTFEISCAIRHSFESVANALAVIRSFSRYRFTVNNRSRSLSVRRHSQRTTIEKAARKCFSKLFDIRRMFIGPEDVVRT